MTSAIHLENLNFQWASEPDPLIKIKELKVAKGEKVFLHGPSGSGKSTLLNLMAGVLTPNSGIIKILNKDFSSFSAEDKDQFRGDHMGFIFQGFNLIPYFNAVENVSLACNFSAKRKAKVEVQGLSVTDEAHRLLEALKLDPEQLNQSAKLSVGQQQRVATARALMGSPDLIFADEPTSALDADNQTAFLELLFNECKKKEITLVFVSHDARLANYFDRSISLSEINQAGKKP